jgi:hypothetical protein
VVLEVLVLQIIIEMVILLEQLLEPTYLLVVVGGWGITIQAVLTMVEQEGQVVVEQVVITRVAVLLAVLLILVVEEDKV